MASTSMPPQLSPVKQEPHVKQESLNQSPALSQAYHPQQQSIYHSQQAPAYPASSQYAPQQQQQQQHQSYYNINRHIMAMSMQHNGNGNHNNHSGANSTAGSAAATPIMASAQLDPNGLSSAPSSPTLNGLQYHNNGGNSHFGSNTNSGSTTPYIPHPSYPQPSSYSNNNSSNNYYNSSPPYSSHQQPSQGQQQQHHGNSTPGSNGSHLQFSSTAPSPMRQHPQQPPSQQYSSLVPPLSESQYAQYHQLLGSSAFSSSQSTPFHSNHSTPYSSMPGSPTHEYQQLGDSSLTQKPKRRQVKNACVNCQKACKKCDEGRPCARCIKYGLTDTCVDSTRKIRKKGIKRGPYKRRAPPSQVGSSASASTTPTMRNAVPTGMQGYMSEPVTALSSPTQSHMLPFTSTAGSTTTMSHMAAPLDFGYDTSGGPAGYALHTQRMEPSYNTPSYANGYSGSSLYTQAPNYGLGNAAGGSSNMP
ncbi:hypothetical protein BGZ99_005517 [Dissophora globulifera]|uniref:Zn(2)-C6 fungal-type domain-containing protein n=1 Tax=Dissophora globulifera TaxID=979702 RepID=A0A9P6UTA7_9FUNG|nr:hypothetical protein BGZ99_005517 [Dissophora globulifera]